jgi:hypothetical protein
LAHYIIGHSFDPKLIRNGRHGPTITLEDTRDITLYSAVPSFGKQHSNLGLRRRGSSLVHAIVLAQRLIRFLSPFCLGFGFQARRLTLATFRSPDETELWAFVQRRLTCIKLWNHDHVLDEHHQPLFFHIFNMRFSLVSAATLVSSATAHTIFQKVSVNGADQGQLKGVRAPDSDYPITNVNDGSFACNKDLTHKDSTVITIPAGAKVGAWWGHVIGGAQGSNDPDNPIAKSHKGQSNEGHINDTIADPNRSHLLLVGESERRRLNRHNRPSVVQSRPRWSRKWQMGRRHHDRKRRLALLHNAYMHCSRTIPHARRAHRLTQRQLSRRCTILHGSASTLPFPKLNLH